MKEGIVGGEAFAVDASIIVADVDLKNAVILKIDGRMLLAERGIAISYETVRRWVNHFGPIIAAAW
jgi:transposase-like protein